jgi:hypothetical protein
MQRDRPFTRPGPPCQWVRNAARETAPCKRPANLSSYASTGDECGPMTSVNADRDAALTAIQNLASAEKE